MYDEMIHSLRMAVLVDNLPGDGLEAEWGLSIYLEADGRCILLDTGASDMFAENAARMGISLQNAEAGVLSHAHYDHADGMARFFKENDHAMFYLQETCRETCYGENDDGSDKYIGIRPGILETYQDRIAYVSGNAQILPGIWLIRHKKKDYQKIALENRLFIRGKNGKEPDDFSHEQSLVLRTEKGLVILDSCSHTGVQNIVEEVREAMGEQKVFAYIGGMHLYRLSDMDIRKLAAYLQKESIDCIYTGHCSSEHGFAVLQEQLGDRVLQFRSGLTANRLQE